MFEGRKKATEPAPELRCSFCRKGDADVRKLIAGPQVYICDECVDVCVDILADDRRASEARAQGVLAGTAAPPAWPASDAWCAFCGNIADLPSALLIENRTLLCEHCVRSIAAAAKEVPGPRSNE
jgi:hypothetical protein